jgi:hypothetical protein
MKVKKQNIPYGKRTILVSDGEHMQWSGLYKEDWLKEWDDEDPMMETTCGFCCDKTFQVIYWLYPKDLFKRVE